MTLAESIVRIKELLPTDLGSEELRQAFPAEILRRSMFTAKMTYVPYLARLRDVCAEVAAGRMDMATAQGRLLEMLRMMGHSSQDGGGITNPASTARLNLILRTQSQMAASFAEVAAQTEATVAAEPAWELMRFVGRKVPRQDWPSRWAAAGNSVGWQGALKGERMIALKASPIWQALGDGAGGFRDTLGNPVPPFAHGSGLAWMGVDRDECLELGLISPGEKVPVPKVPDIAPSRTEIEDAEQRYGFKVDITAEVP